MEFVVRKASKKKARGRLCIEGQTGGGKTYSAILIAKCMIGEPHKLPPNVTSKITLIDTERNSAELYQDEFDFNVIELPPEGYNSIHYLKALRTAEATAGVVILDSLSHEWSWCLAEVDRLAPIKFAKNKWAAWSDVRPPHDAFVDAMMASPAHVIATIRSKMATVQDRVNDRTVIREVGLEAQQDNMIKYAFTVAIRMDDDHNGTITKTRCRALDKQVFPLPGQEFTRIYIDWLESGVVDNRVANTVEAAIQLGVTRSLEGATSEERKVAFADAKVQLTDWCKAHGLSKEAHDAAQTEMARVVRVEMTRRAEAAAAALSAPIVGEKTKTDEEQLRAIDEARA